MGEKVVNGIVRQDVDKEGGGDGAEWQKEINQLPTAKCFPFVSYET